MKQRGKRDPVFLEALIGLILVIAVIVLTIRLKAGLSTPLVLGVTMSGLVAYYLGFKWKEIQKSMVDGISNSVVSVLILIVVGMIVGIWLIGGTVPTLIYYGLKLMSPTIFLPFSFVFCAVTSLATGSFAGTVPTVGLALMGVGMGMGVPPVMTAGAVTAGAIFGDKMSPLSDTTNVAAAVTETDLFKHIGSMMWTTLPAALICIVIYQILGMKFIGTITDLGEINAIMDALQSHFNLSLFTLIPPLIVLVLSIKKVPAIVTLVIAAVISAFIAMLTQGLGIKAVMGATMAGYKSSTGLAMVDRILTSGGINMVTGVIVMIIAATAMGGILESCGILKVLLNSLLKYVKSSAGLIISTLVSCYLVLMVSGNMMLGIILPGRTFVPAYKEKRIETRVLSRSLEDAGTLGSLIIPWGLPAIYSMGVLNVGPGFIPYSLLSFIVPIFSLIYAFTGIAVWKDTSNQTNEL